MPFLLSRGGKNVITEVQRWQYFLRRQGISQIGKIDGDFGQLTETGTRFFQVQAGIPTTGKLDTRTLQAAASLGYTVLPDDHYEQLKQAGGPPKPTNLRSPDAATRDASFGCFKFVQLPIANRDRPERIVIRGSCDGAVADWVAANIVTVGMPQLELADGYTGRFRCHRQAEPLFRTLFEAWQKADLLHLIISYAGAFDARYIKGGSPGDAAHSARLSRDVSSLSNHAFGSAFDINTTQNWIGNTPADYGEKGCVRELVGIANKASIYWGGHFGGTRVDGMHFEIAAS